MPVLQVVLPVIFAALAGGITNSVAIWMLFHPYEPPRLRGRRLLFLQGAIPKNKDRLAAAMGRTVGRELLTPADVVRAANQPVFQQEFERRLREAIAGALQRERQALRDELPAALAAELDSLLGDVARTLTARLDEYLASDEFREAVTQRVQELAGEVSDQPIGQVLTEAREAAITAAAERWLTEAVGSAGFEAAVDEYLTRATERLLEPGRTFEQILPLGLVATLEKAIAGYMPIAIERLGRLLEDPSARPQVERILHEVLDRFMRDLKFHQRLVAALVITPDTIDRVLRAVEAEGAAKLSELLQDEAVRDAMARNVNDAIVEFLRRPVRSVVGAPDDEAVREARVTVRRWALALARDPQTTAFLIEKLRATLTAAERRTWGELLRHVPAERLADLIVAASRSERASLAYRESAAALGHRLLTRPIGRLARHLPADAPDRLQLALAAPLWSWVLQQVPDVVERIDVARRVQEKIMEFPPQRVEALIRGVTERELKLIVRLGYVLGAIIGLVSVSLTALLR